MWVSVCIRCQGNRPIYPYPRPAAADLLFSLLYSLVPLIGGLAPVINANEPPASYTQSNLISSVTISSVSLPSILKKKDQLYLI